MSSDQTFAIVVGLVAAAVFMLVRVLQGPIGEALARRLGGYTQ